MRRSSWILLIFAGSLLFITSLVYSITYAEQAPPMSLAEAARIVETGRKAVERGDLNGFFALFADNAMILGRTRADAREEIAKSISELRGNFSLSIRNLEVRPEGRSAQLTFTMDIGQKDDRMDVVYYPDVRMRARVEKLRVKRWWGLFESEQWLVTDLESDPPIQPKAEAP